MSNQSIGNQDRPVPLGMDGLPLGAREQGEQLLKDQQTESEQVERPPDNSVRWLWWWLAYALAAIAGLGMIASESQLHFMGLAMSVLGGFFLFIALVVGFVVVFIVSDRRTMRRAVRWLVCPITLALCFAITTSGLPLRARFELSRSDFERARIQLEAGERSYYSYPSGVGLMPVDSAEKIDGGGDFFRIAGAGLFEDCGIIYWPNGGKPDGYRLETDLGDSWWTGCYSGGY